MIQKIIDLNQNQNINEETILFHDNEMFQYYDEGMTRFVFVNEDKTKVIKILKSNNSFDYNKEENDIYQNAQEEIKKEMAETKLVNGFIEQEFVLPIKFSNKDLTIKQMLFAATSRDEVGWDKDGSLKCFDLSEYRKY